MNFRRLLSTQPQSYFFFKLPNHRKRKHSVYFVFKSRLKIGSDMKNYEIL